MTYRLFAAIRPPDPIRERLLDIEEGIANARWQEEDQLHLTLRFFGEVETTTANELAEALGRVDCEPFELALAGVDYFEKKGTPHSSWAGIGKSEPLMTLHRRVERASRSAGLAPEKRKFVPHITIARLDASAGPVAPFLARHAGMSGEPWRVDSFTLYESRLARDGARYTPLEIFPLRS